MRGKLKVAILADFPLHTLPDQYFAPPAAHYATWLPPLAVAFQQVQGLEIHWISMRAGLEKEQTHDAWGQFFHVLPTTFRGRATTLFWGDRRRIRRKLACLAPHVVHGWGNEDVWGWATLESGLPHLFSVQGLLGVYGKMGHQNPRERLMALIEKVVLRKAQVVTTESAWAKAQIEAETGRQDVRLVEYGIPQRFFEVERCPDFENPYALLVGTVDYRKGIDVAVQIFSRPGLKRYSLKVVGGISPFGERCKKNSPPNIEWLGRKTQDEIVHLLRGAHCLILPTRADVCANVVKEARVIGLPVVASPNGGHVQYIQHGKNGFICDLNSPESWEKALLEIIHDNTTVTRMGNFLRDAHRNLLRPALTAEAFLDLYRKIFSDLKSG